MRFWKKRLQRVAAMVCSVALVASMMPTAAFATEPEPTPTPEPTPIVETAPTPEPSGSPENTDAAVTTSAPDADADSTAAPVETPTETPDGTAAPVETPTETPDGTPAPSEEPVESPEPSEGPADGTPAPSEKPVESPEPSEVPAEQVQSVPQTLAAGIENGHASLTLNKSKVAFAGHEWWVIGYKGKGVYPNDGHVTLLAANLDADFEHVPFRIGQDDPGEGYTRYWYYSEKYYANNPEGMKPWTTPNEYAGSNLQQQMEEWASAFPEKEQGVITARDLTDSVNWRPGDPKLPDGIVGQGVANQKLWALSDTEWSIIKDREVREYGWWWWLRSPGSDEGHNAKHSLESGTGLDRAPVWNTPGAARPALSLNLESVLFTSAAEGGKSSATVGNGLVVAEAPTETETVKFTMKDPEQTLKVNATTETGETLYFSYSDATTGENQYVSCILIDENGEVKYYGKLANSSSTASGDISVPLAGVADGTYTLKIFSEQANGNLYTDFCSEPVSMKVTVTGGEGTVTPVENPDVTVTKSLTAITRNGEEVTSIEPTTELKVGDEITYEIKVENTGNVNLSGLTVTDTFNGNGTLPEVKDADGYVVGQWDETSGVWTYEIANLPVNDEETFTYTYTVVQLDAAETDGLTNTAAVSGDGTDPDDDKAEDERPVKDDGPVTMEIADITTYMGGIAGYDGAVEGGNATQSNSLPEPGFYFTLQGNINSELSTALGYKSTEAVDLSQYITLTATDKDGITHTWSLEKYGNEHSVSMEDGIERYVYKIDNQAGAPIRVEFKNDADDIVTNDNFSVDDALAENYTMSIYLGDVEVDSISFAIRIPKSRDDNTTVKTYYCGFEGGKTNAILTVRHTTGEAKITLAEENLETALENTNKQDDFLVEVTQNHDININEAGGADGVDVTHKDVYLLADGIEELESEASLEQTAQEQAKFESSETEAKYLDLVDANNGNAWLTSEQQVTVYWPYPEGTDRNTNFKLFHYEGMDRDTTATVTPEEVAIEEKTETGITFKTSSFSPFVLVWDTTQPSGGGDEPSGGDDGNNDNNNDNTNTNTNNQTTTVNVANQAPAPAAAPAAAVIPQTGDDMPVGLLAGLAVVAAGGIAALLVLRKRRSK